MASMEIGAGAVARDYNTDLFTDGGELGLLMRDMDWSRTLLGPVSSWPRALKTSVRIMLTSRQPMFVWWGSELINLYNDAYRAILGGKHPQALGQPAAVVWREIWGQVAPRARSAMDENRGTYDEALMLIMERNGYPEETYYTFSYSPVPNDEGGIGGILCANTDDTRRVIGERQLGMLRELATRTADARTVEAACALSAAGLDADPRDLPFGLIYLYEPEQRRFVLRGTCGVAAGHAIAPAQVDHDDDSIWPLGQALRTPRGSLYRSLSDEPSGLPTGPWDRAPAQAVVLPISPPSQTSRSAVLVAGLNPYRLIDNSYEGFLGLVASQLAAAMANAQAYEDERKRAEALAELDRAKTTFFSNVSHELRTPLTLILGPVEDALAKSDAESGLAGEDLRVLHRNGQRLLKLVNTLLDFSRLEAGRIQAHYEPVDLAAFSTELASVFRSAFERAGLSLTIDCPRLSQQVYVDREMWEKIILNLLSNAFKFTFQGGATVTLREADGQAELILTDSGIGIPEGELEHVFERFHRVSAAEGRSHEGTGIGLALVHELVRLHGGQVEVNSRVGEGSTFTVRLPFGKDHLPADRIGVRAANAPSGATPYLEEALRWLPTSSEDQRLQVTDLSFLPPRDSTQTRRSVLVADDNADMRDYLRRLLEGRYEVQTAANGEAALAHIREQMPDLVLSDIMMPGLDGAGLLSTLRGDPHTKTLPVILLSARAGEDSKVEGLEAGADDYLTKPFSARELLARIDAHIELARVRKSADEALRASEDRFRRLFEANIIAVVFWDPEGRIFDANEAFLRMLGYSREDLSGGQLRLDQLIPAEFKELHKGAREELLACGVCTPYETEFIRADGERVPILLGAAILAAPHGSPDSCAAFCLDLTERRRMDEQLRQTQKLESLGVLAGGVAHDFNNLLVGIMGNASLALETTPSHDMNHSLLEEVVRASERAADLTKQLLAYAGKGRFIIEPVDLSGLVREIVKLIQAAIPKNVQLRLDLQAKLPRTEADASQLQQLAMNLIINGAEAVGEQNGWVQVSTGVQSIGDYEIRTMFGGQDVAPGNYVFLEVQDNGSGMDADTLTKIFDPFFTTKFMGRGLGLAAAQGIVRGHKGAICVRSIPGKGSTFQVFLPVRAGEQGQRRAAPAHDVLTGTGLILVVDDEEMVRRTVKATLQRYGYSVLTAENGQEAVDLFREVHGRVLMVVLDMTMPVMGGEETLEHLQAIEPEVKVILSSGYNEVEAIRRFTGKGLAGFIQKPYTAADLAEKIKVTAGKRRSS